MADDKNKLLEAAQAKIVSNVCGPSTKACVCNCPDSCDHVWDGPPISLEGYGGGGGSSVTCSRPGCGADAFSHDLWVAP